MKTLYFGGPLLTMDRTAPWAEALITDDGYIVAVGSLADMEKLAVGANRVDLRGNTLMPAFVDGHGHMAGTGLCSMRCDLTGCTGFDDLLERIRTFRTERDLTHGEAILCRGYDPSVMEEQRHPDAAVLDRLEFDNPICCEHQSGHMLFT